MSVKRTLLLGFLFALVLPALGPVPASADPDPCLAIDANGNGEVDQAPSDPNCLLLTNFKIEPKKPQPVVDLAFHTVHAGFVWTPSFDPNRIDDPTLWFGDADTPANRAHPPVTGRCKSSNLNGDGVPDKICKWWTTDTHINPSDTSACVHGQTIDGYKIEACAPLTTINGANPSLTINDVSVTEGASGQAPQATFTVSLTPAAANDVTVSWVTINGTAVAPDDYGAGSGSLTFTAGQTSQPLAISIVGDDVIEADETFSVTLSNASGATIGDANGLGTILSDDAPVSASVNDVSVVEGNSGTTNATFTVSLTPPASGDVTVSYETADGTAVAPGDYTATSGQVTFTAGQSTKQVTVPVSGESDPEPNETFTLNISSLEASIGDGQGVGTIVNDDAVPVIGINDIVTPEGNSGTTTVFFTVSLSAPSAMAVSVNYTTANGLAKSPGDFIATTGLLTFDPGETQKTIAVSIVGDTVSERAEGFTMQLANPSGATVGDSSGQCLITNDDG